MGRVHVGVTEETFKDWISVPAAVKLLADGFDQDDHAARIILIQGLRGGVIRAVAQTTSRDGGQAVLRQEIPPEDWEDLTTKDLLWTTGHVSYSVRNERGGYAARYIMVRRFGVRLEPDSVHALLPQAAPERVAASQPPEPPLPVTTGRPVSPAHLSAWYDAYQKIYGGTAEDTEPNALASARAMLPGKLVSREAVRKLRGEQKPGPKGPRNSGE